MAFRLRFPPEDIPHWAARFSFTGGDEIPERLGSVARRRGHLTKPEFLKLCRWKTPRSEPRCKLNSPALVREATHLALATTDEHLKIGILRVLHGVEWPTASVILHFCDRSPYPILDYRALWSLGFPKPPAYTYEFWHAYTAYTRDLSRRTGHSMRVVDRALWQYSKERQW
jgi:hypothetical protein